MSTQLEVFCALAVERGASHARVVLPDTVITAPWVRLKCQFGCPGYGRNYTCPPLSPTPEQTRATLDGYQHGILIHTEAPLTPDLLERRRENRKMVVDLERELFLAGYYKAFAFLSGACALCKECGKVRGELCQQGLRVRPSMEACGIDVYQTAHNHGFPLKPLRGKAETRNYYALIMVD